MNAASGGGKAKELRRLAAEEFRSQGVEADILIAKGGARLAELARRASVGEASTVVAAGGDGTVNAVASALFGTDKRLGILPVGTFNYFAKNLGIPLDLAGAVRTVAHGRGTEVDA